MRSTVPYFVVFPKFLHLINESLSESGLSCSRHDDAFPDNTDFVRMLLLDCDYPGSRPKSHCTVGPDDDPIGAADSHNNRHARAWKMLLTFMSG